LRGCARIESRLKNTQFPSFAEIEEQCGDEYEELLQVLHEDELFEPADLDEQERLVEVIRGALDDTNQDLIEQLVDNQAAQVWLQQEGAFHLGMAVGLRLAQAGYRIREDDEPIEVDEAAEEDARRFGRYHYDPDYDEDQEEDDEEDGAKKS
jgi:hypothetical protein